MQPVKEKKSTFSFFKSKKPVSDSSKLSSTNSIGRTAKHVDSKIDVKSQNVTYTVSTSFPPQSNTSRKLPTPPPRKSQVNDQPLTKTIQGQTFNIIFAPKEEIDAFEESVMTYVNMKADIERKNYELERREAELIAVKSEPRTVFINGQTYVQFTSEEERAFDESRARVEEYTRKEAKLLEEQVELFDRLKESDNRLIDLTKNDQFHLLLNLTKYHSALLKLPINWNKTGESEQNFQVMVKAINDAITLINNYNHLYKGSQIWDDDREINRKIISNAMDTADKIIEYVEYLKNKP